MSDHNGSYRIHHVIHRLETEKVLEQIGRERTRDLVLAMITIATVDHDCNSGEILAGYDEKLAICCCCRRTAVPLDERALCEECQKLM